MSILYIFFFILLLSSLCFSLSHHRRTSIFIFLAFCIGILLISSGFIPKQLCQRLQNEYVAISEPNWAKNNAIILLGGGVEKLPINHTTQPSVLVYSRINKATQLYRSCLKTNNNCTVIISGGATFNTGETEALVYAKELIQLGVKQQDILLESKSLNTYQNVYYTRNLIDKGHFDKLFLVTSGLHLKRALLYYADFNIRAYPCASDYSTTIVPYGFSIGYNFALTDFAIHEYMGIARLYIDNYLGWNKNYHSHQIK